MLGRFDKGRFELYTNEDLVTMEELDCYLFDTKYGFGESYESVLELVNNLGYYSLKEGLDKEIECLIVKIISIFNNVRPLVFNGINEIDINEMIDKLKKIDLDSVNENIEPTLKKYAVKQISKRDFDDFKHYKDVKSDWKRIDENIEIPEEIEYINSYADGDIVNEIFCKNDLIGWGIILRKSGERELIFKYLQEMLHSFGNISLEKKFLFERFGWVEISPLTLHIEVIQGLNMLIRALNYLLNSTSYRNNECFLFDKVEIDKAIDVSKMVIKRAIPVIEYQRNQTAG